MIKAILFDFDGVLTIDGSGSETICNYICKRTGMDLELLKKEYYKYNDDLLYGKIQHEDIWDKVFDAITISAEVGSGKDFNTIFERTIDCLNVNADECVFIDNQEKNLIVPKSMGMKVIYFNHDERNYEKLIQDFKELAINIT